jgi:hypothetical protein
MIIELIHESFKISLKLIDSLKLGKSLFGVEDMSMNLLPRQLKRICRAASKRTIQTVLSNHAFYFIAEAIRPQAKPSE